MGPDRIYDCNYEQPIGSSIAKLACRSEKQKQEDREIAQQSVREVQWNTSMQKR